MVIYCLSLCIQILLIKFLQGEAIAHNLRTMFGLKVPIITIVTGEGGSGGALAIACANKLLMLENAAFYVARWKSTRHLLLMSFTFDHSKQPSLSLVSPEACAAILWKSSQAAPKVYVATNDRTLSWLNTFDKLSVWNWLGSWEAEDHCSRTL